MAGFLSVLAPIAGRLLSSGSLLKSAYGNGAMGLMNLGMDAIPLAMDVANNDVGLKSFSSFGGTMLGTKFGGKELNKLGAEKLESDVLDRATNYKNMVNTTAGPYRPFDADSKAFKQSLTSELTNDPKYSRQGYNMAIGFGADAGLYSLTSGMNKPKSNSGLEDTSQGFNNSPVSKYMQMTGAL